MNKRQEILRKFKSIRRGKIFDNSALMSPGIKAGDVAYMVCMLKKTGELKTIANGTYYRPRKSVLGLGDMPVSRKEIIAYYTDKLDSHLSGQYGFNLIGLTEQCAYTVTLAGRKRFKAFNAGNCRFDYAASPIGRVAGEDNLRLTIFLDALQDINGVTGKNSEDVLRSSERLIHTLDEKEQDRLIKMAANYPPRVRYILATLIEATTRKENTLRDTITNLSLYDKKYKNILPARISGTVR